MKIEKILVGTDTSQPSEIAVEQAAALALRLEAELILMYVGAKPEDHHELPAVFATSAEMVRLAEEMFHHDQRVVEQLAGQAEETGVAVRRHVVSGSPAEKLCEAAESFDVDLVVTGTHGRTGIDRFLLGSVAERVVRCSHRPVMVARGEDAHSRGFAKILVPTDFSPQSERALDLAMALGTPDCAIELLHCWTLPAGVGAGPASVLQPIVRSVEREIESRGEALISQLVERGGSVTFHAVRKAPAQGVADRIAEANVDLVVMGSHGRRGLSRLLLGSVTTATLHEARCSVVVVPPEPEGQPG